MTQPSKRTLEKQADLIEDRPFVVPLGRHRFHARYLKSFNDLAIARMVVKASPEPVSNTAQLIELMSRQGTLAPRFISRMILGSLWKITLFHWVFWRWIHYTFNQRQMTEALVAVFDAADLGFFFQNMKLITETSTSLRKRMTQTELKQLSAELQSESVPPLLKNLA